MDNRQFAKLGEPGFWLNGADELKDAADILLFEAAKGNWRIHVMYVSDKTITKPRASKGYILLTGFALENLLKGILVTQDPSHINQGRLSSFLKTHDLLKLFSKAKGIRLGNKQLKTLETISNGLIYWGRYPIPLIASQIQDEIVLNRKLAIDIEALYKKFHKFLYREINKGWDSGIEGISISRLYLADYGDDVKNIVTNKKNK